MHDSDVAPNKRWWGEFNLDDGQLGRWRLGPLDLWISRTALDWRYGAVRTGEGDEDLVDVRVPMADAEGTTLPDELGRFGYSQTESTIELAPALANRPVVVRPAVPFFVPPGQKIELFVSTPLWIKLRVGKAELAEIPTTRPSDTWFGTNTRGELAYAGKTRVRRQFNNVLLRSHRAVSCLTVRNHAEDVLALERLSLPVPQLSLFVSETGTLWTEHVGLKSEADGEFAEVSLGKGAPNLAGASRQVAEPRAPQGRSFGSLVFGGLFETGY